MGKIVWDVSVSLDGFTSGPNVREAEPMGDGGDGPHTWRAGDNGPGDVDRRAADAINANIGATLVGRRTFDLGLKNWGGTPWPGVPSFVITHRPLENLRGDNGGLFFFDGLEAAAHRARDAAGQNEVRVLGATVARQLLTAGLIDEIWMHVVPLLLGGGARMFDGERVELVPDGKVEVGAATHLRFRVGKV